jgi:POT family proton-dependent oligopeptide transporter
MSKYRTAPTSTDRMPTGIPYIIGNEAAERFSFYGMKTILAIFMTKHLMDSGGKADLMNEGEATIWVHGFTTAVYFTPLLGSFIADAFFGKYKTIVSLSLVYCLGHLALALDETRTGLTIGLTLIAIGAGGIKGCVSAHVGDQFGKKNATLIEKVYGWFYLSINLGAFLSTMLTPWLLKHHGPSVAFGVPGLLMLIATITFWAGRREFAHVPPRGMAFIRETFSPAGLRVMRSLIVIYAMVAMFWALFDQTASTWVFQAQKMDRNFLGMEWLPSQIQAVNPALILILIPLFNWWLYPTISKYFPLTPLRKISIGFFLVVPSFLIPAWIEYRLGMGPGVFLHPGSPFHEIAGTRAVHGIGRLGQPLHRGGQRHHPERGRKQQTGWARVLFVLCRGDVPDRPAFHPRGDELQGEDLLARVRPPRLPERIIRRFSSAAACETP